jgi:hypothetical protein
MRIHTGRSALSAMMDMQGIPALTGFFWPGLGTALNRMLAAMQAYARHVDDHTRRCPRAAPAYGGGYAVTEPGYAAGRSLLFRGFQAILASISTILQQEIGD